MPAARQPKVNVVQIRVGPTRFVPADAKFFIPPTLKLCQLCQPGDPLGTARVPKVSDRPAESVFPPEKTGYFMVFTLCHRWHAASYKAGVGTKTKNKQ